jgi:hypothetical protein
LEWLRIEPEIPELETAGEFEELVRWIAQTWVCKVGAGGLGLVTKEVKRPDLPYRVSRRFREELLEMGEWHRKLWDELWPSRGGDWREEWSSLPLVGAY